MSRSAIALLGLVVANALAWSAVPGLSSVTAPQPPPAPSSGVGPGTGYASEQQWLVTDVATAIAGMAGPAPAGAGVAQSVSVELDPASASRFTVILPAGRRVKLTVEEHLWSAATYAPLAAALFSVGEGGEGGAQQKPAANQPATDLNVRAALADLRVAVLLDQNERLSTLLTEEMRSARAHESAALLVGAHALREAPGIFADVRPALSRMTAHLAIAAAVRGDAPESLDGTLARAVQAVLVWRQRDALAIVDAFERRAATVTDRAWVRALRLRATGDWRKPLLGEAATLLERLEYARALKMRIGSDALLSFLDTFEPPDVTDWHRIALSASGSSFNVESGHRFTDGSVESELSESEDIWSRLHRGGTMTGAGLLSALNEPPALSPAQTLDGRRVVTVLDWGTWAAFQQRQLCHILTARSRHLWNLGATDAQEQLVAELAAQFSSLTLYPVVLRWAATGSADYERSVAAARTLVAARPQLVTVAAWNLLAEQPDYVRRAAAFPFVASWFNPAVPTGTAFDLHARALLPGCPRPPSRAQARVWADAAPFDHWTVWSADWLAVDGKPSVAAVRRGFGPLVEYDYPALLKMLDYLEMQTPERIAIAEKICDIATHRCDVVAGLLLGEGRDADATLAYERWIRGSRGRVQVSNGLTWLVRHYEAQGRRERAEQLARMAAEVGSGTGLETLGYLLDGRGDVVEAQQQYQEIADRYRDTVALGTFLVRQGMRAGDKTLELKGWDNLRQTFPNGIERLAMHALDVTPVDGVAFNTFSRRASATGLRATDVVVGVDEWRVRSHRQYIVLARLRHEDAIVLTVWRDGRYQQLRTRVPERWLGVQLRDHSGPGVSR